MSSPGFVHLHTHTEFSILDGASRIPDLVKQAVEMEMPSLAITDHGVMYGNLKFYSEAKSAGIKPILGCEVYVAPRARTDRDPRLDKEQYHLVLLAKSEQGYRNLIKLVSIAFSEGFYYKPRVDKELLAQYSGDLIALTACLGGEIPKRIREGNMERAERSLGEYVDIFGRENLYLEIQDHFLPDQKPVNEGLIALAGRTGLPLVATNDIHYAARQDAEAQDILLCIQTGSTMDDPNRFKFGTQEFYMKSGAEMAKLFPGHPEALANTLEIAERCNIKFDFGRSKMPDPGVPEGVSASDHMASEATKGLRERLGGQIPPEYQKQLEYEIGIINQCGFPMYMLIVRDFTSFARRTGICVGARGSAAASLVGYGLGITDVDPIEYGLAFERFLNPERAQMPDVDLDIQDDRREELIQYVVDKYGRDHVGQIATFGSLKARAAVRDCGRVLGMDLAEVDRICKMIPSMPVGIKIDQAIEENPDLQDAYKNDAQAAKLLDTAKKLEGINRNVGIHAAGVLICHDPLTDHVPVHHGNNGEVVAQLGKKDIEKIGLLKMDFLGLANLTILAESVKNVERYRGEKIDLLNLPLDNQKTFDMLGRGDTNGVFQLEGAGMRRNVIDLKPNSVRELAAIVALYRPGPLAEIPRFVRSKHGLEPVSYIHPDLEPILSETYGVICYQEQVLQIARSIAGFTLGQADVLRRGMSSKNKAVMDEQRVKFLDGARKNGVDEAIATKIYEQIEPFAGYAFNKAHAVCYAFVAYRTAYMKANYPVEYYTALLSANMDDKEKLSIYIDDCHRLGVEVHAPDVNNSGAPFEVEGGGIRFGLAAIKGVGRGAIDVIVAVRNADGPFKSLHEFCRRVCDSSVTRSTVECLVKAGAFDTINKNRAQLLFVLDDAMALAARDQKDKKSGQTSLFGGVSEETSGYLEPTTLPQVTEFPREEQLNMEKDLLGLYFSDHPLLQYKEKLDKIVTATSDSLGERADKEDVVIAGTISKVRTITTRKGDLMAFVGLEDMKGSIDVTVFPSSYQENRKNLVVDTHVIIKGKVSRRERIKSDGDSSEEVGVILESVTLLSNGNGSGDAGGNGNGGSKAVNIRIDGAPREAIKTLRYLLGANCGECPVYMHVTHDGAIRRVCADLKVDPTPKLLGDIQQLLGREVVWLE